jgi:hypothetical protein
MPSGAGERDQQQPHEAIDYDDQMPCSDSETAVPKDAVVPSVAAVTAVREVDAVPTASGSAEQPLDVNRLQYRDSVFGSSDPNSRATWARLLRLAATDQVAKLLPDIYGRFTKPNQRPR